MSEENFWHIHVPKLKTIIRWIKSKLSENHNVKRGRTVVREMVITFKERTKLAITTAIAYLLWKGFYDVISSGLNVFFPYTGFFESIIHLVIIILISVVTLVMISKWE